MADTRIQEKIDRVLDNVKGDGLGLTVVEPGLVEKVRVSEDKKKLTLFLRGVSGGKACCAIMNCAVLETIELQMKQAFQREFPAFEIYLANA